MTIYSIIHGAEFWLATVIYLIGVASGILLFVLFEWLGDRDGR